MTMFLRCPNCKSTFESDIQLPREVYERSALEGNSQQCPSCGDTVVLSDDTVFFADSNPSDTGHART